MMPNANPENTAGSTPNVNETEMLRNLNRAMFGESTGYMAELSRLNDPVKVKEAIPEVSASSVGLPAVDLYQVVKEFKLENGDISEHYSYFQMVSDSELMKIFIDPDWSAGQKDAGYQANVSINMALNSTSRDEVIMGVRGPGKYGQEDAVKYVKNLISSGELKPENTKKAYEMVLGTVKPEALQVTQVLADAAPVVKARAEFWRAYGEYAQTSGDEKAGADIFKAPGHGSPTGPDFQAFFPKDNAETGGKDGTKKDNVMRQIYAAGLPYDKLVHDGKVDLAIDGVHYKSLNYFLKNAKNGADKEAVTKKFIADVEVVEKKKAKAIADLLATGNEKDRKIAQELSNKSVTARTAKDGLVIVEKGNIYVDGFNSENFKAWMDALIQKTEGNLLMAYDAWYSSIAMGLVAKVAFNGVKVGDPPWVSSADSWFMHFGKKQKAEAGLDVNGKREKFATYVAKTGPVVGIDKYPETWVESFFDNATLGKDGPTIFEQWWNKDVKLCDIPWLVLGQEIGGTEEEVKLNGFDGFLYKKMQLFKLLETIQNVPALGDICKYTFWQGAARTLDKALGVVYDVDTPENRVKATKNKLANLDSQVVEKDGVKFIKMLPDSRNPRITLFKGLLSRYSMDWKNDSVSGTDTPVAIGERFTSLSEKQLKEMVVVGGAKKPEMIGVPIELYLRSVVDSGMLTVKQVFAAIIDAYGKDKFDSIYVNSDWVKIAFQKVWEEYKTAKR